MNPLPATHQRPSCIDDATEAQHQDSPSLHQHLSHVSPESARINDAHPLLRSYYLDVDSDIDCDDAPKSSGPQNLLREGWDKERKFGIDTFLNQVDM